VRIPETVCPDLAAHARLTGERVVRGDRSVEVQTKDLPFEGAQVLRLDVGGGAGARGAPISVVGVPDSGIELSVRADPQPASVVIAPGAPEAGCGSALTESSMPES